MNGVISTGIEQIDSVCGTGGLPLGALIEFHGLSAPQLTAFVDLLLSGNEHAHGQRLSISLGTDPAPPLAHAERALAQDVAILVLLAEDVHAEIWIRDPSNAKSLRSLAMQYNAAIVCALPLRIRLQEGRISLSSGLASAATLRLQIKQRTDSLVPGYRIRVVKNAIAPPFSETEISANLRA